jgi:hypothetical protein
MIINYKNKLSNYIWKEKKEKFVGYSSSLCCGYCPATKKEPAKTVQKPP